MYWRQVLASSQMNRGKAVNLSSTPQFGDPARQSFSGWEPKKLFLQQADGGFEEAAYADGFDSRADGRSLAAVDLDGDGDQDLVMASREEPRVDVFKNRSRSGNSLELALHQPKGLKDGAGSLVRVTSGGTTRAFAAVLARGYATATPARVHVGLGAAETADVEVTWPDRTTQRFAGLNAGNLWHLTRGVEQAKAVPFAKKADAPWSSAPRTLEAFGLEPDEKALTVVAFVSRGCEPCKKEMPILNELAKGKVRVIGIGTDGLDAESAAATKKLLKTEFEVIPLTEQLARSMESMGAFTLPVTIVYGRDGRWLRVVRNADALNEALSR